MNTSATDAALPVAVSILALLTVSALMTVFELILRAFGRGGK